ALLRGRARRRLCRGLEYLLELTRLEELGRDVAAADQLAVDVELRERRPVRIHLETLANLGVLKNVDVCEARAGRAQNRDGFRREAALRKIRSALHVEQHGV